MVWTILMVSLALIALAAAVVLSTRGWSPSTRLVAVAAAVLVAPVVGGLLWKGTLVAVAITAVTVLALAAMFGKVPAGKAVEGALVGFFLIFAFSWLAFTLADVFLYGKTDVSFVPAAFSNRQWYLDIEWDFLPSLACAAGIAAIVVAGLLPVRARGFLSLPGLIAILWFGPTLLETVSYSNPDLALLRNPFFQGALLIAAVIASAQWLSASRSQNR